MLTSLAVLASAGPFRIESASARAPVAAQYFVFDCEPTRLYRGDTLTVTFHSPHDDADLAISNAGGQKMVISFKRRPEDKVDPVIPHDQFGRMQTIRLDTATARGSMINKWAHGGTPAVLDPPQLIFTESGSYDVVVSSDIMSPHAEIDVCDLNYYDYPKPPISKRAEQAPKTPPKR
ncbi:MAG TPA: hypothetical protein VNF29_09750 [Candidatus Binataceae bacterium]|nr:hypothetical protein [Candidatus Binataceae bacterium]